MPVLDDIAKQRARFIDSRQDLLSELGKKLQEKILQAILTKFRDEFDVSQGRIVLNRRNISAAAALKRVFEKFVSNEQIRFVTQFVEDIQKITTLNGQYFGQLSDSSQAFKKTATRVADLMEFRLGITGSGKLVKDMFLDRFIHDEDLSRKVRESILKGVTNQIPMSDLVTDLRYNLLGAQGIDGPIVRKYNDYIFDVYQQHDRATSSIYADTLGLECFIYAGGLIDTSREFCQKRNGKVFSVEEAQDWVNDETLPRTKEERKAGAITNYNPVIDCGRWRCRHHVNYIPTALAKRMRPDIKLAA